MQGIEKIYRRFDGNNGFQVLECLDGGLTI